MASHALVVLASVLLCCAGWLPRTDAFGGVLLASSSDCVDHEDEIASLSAVISATLGVTVGVTCAEVATYCTDASVGTLVRSACGATCQACAATTTLAPGVSTTPPVCADNAALGPAIASILGISGMASCSLAAPFCNNSQLRTFLVLTCPVTCQACDPSAPPPVMVCEDNDAIVVLVAARKGLSLKSCADVKFFCASPTFGPALSLLCPVTCNTCVTPPPPTLASTPTKVSAAAAATTTVVPTATTTATATATATATTTTIPTSNATSLPVTWPVTTTPEPIEPTRGGHHGDSDAVHGAASDRGSGSSMAGWQIALLVVGLVALGAVVALVVVKQRRRRAHAARVALADPFAAISPNQRYYNPATVLHNPTYIGDTSQPAHDVGGVDDAAEYASIQPFGLPPVASAEDAFRGDNAVQFHPSYSLNSDFEERESDV